MLNDIKFLNLIYIMPLTPINRIHKNRLAQELNAMGLDPSGSRSELLTRLYTAGIYDIHPEIPPPKKKMQLYNHSNILLGQAAQLTNGESDKFIVHNTEVNKPLISGDFKNNSINLPTLINISESEINPDIEGIEGDIRRNGSELYMYRSTGVHPGWYPLTFGTVMII